jgi:hypothetical protein
MHVVDNAANESRQLDGSARSGNISTKSSNDRLAATRNNVGCFGNRFVERGGFAANPCLSHARSFSVVRSVGGLGVV